MREILFRGKRKDNGEWVYGGIVHQTDFYGDKVDNYFIIDGTVTEDNNIGYSYEVIPETVGQYTGVTDRNGKNVFEGDLLRFNNGTTKGYVYWDNKILQYKIKITNNKYWKRTVFEILRSFEVIGNIYDNRDLLE